MEATQVFGCLVLARSGRCLVNWVAPDAAPQLNVQPLAALLAALHSLADEDSTCARDVVIVCLAS